MKTIMSLVMLAVLAGCGSQVVDFPEPKPSVKLPGGGGCPQAIRLGDVVYVITDDGQVVHGSLVDVDTTQQDAGTPDSATVESN